MRKPNTQGLGEYEDEDLIAELTNRNALQPLLDEQHMIGFRNGRWAAVGHVRSLIRIAKQLRPAGWESYPIEAGALQRVLDETENPSGLSDTQPEVARREQLEQLLYTLRSNPEGGLDRLITHLDEENNAFADDLLTKYTNRLIEVDAFNDEFELKELMHIVRELRK